MINDRPMYCEQCGNWSDELPICESCAEQGFESEYTLGDSQA